MITSISDLVNIRRSTKGRKAAPMVVDLIDDIACLHISSLDTVYVVLLDLEDYVIILDSGLAIGLTYAVDSLGLKRHYARISVNGTKYYLHRLIVGAKDQYVDHKNNDTCDNRRINLRLCTQAENMQNRLGAQANSYTKELGVYWIASRNKYGARVTINGENYNLGQYFLKEDAITAVKDFRSKHVPFSKEATCME